MPRHTLYWVLQLTGWALVILFNVPFMLMSGRPFTLANSITVMALTAYCGLLLTHAWRAWVKRQHYLELPLKQFIGRYVASTFILGSLLTFLAGLWYRIFLFPDTFHRANWVAPAFFFWFAMVAIWTIIYVVARTVRRSGELEKQHLQTELLARDARLAVLRQQLNPHFLFNSLNSLRALIFEDSDKASQMVDRLATLLRYSLQSESNEIVTLADELVMVDQYLSIENIRFEERLLVDMQISENSRSAQLPRMLVQTLVENAVKHGIERSVSGGAVTVHSTTTDGNLKITVRNPGTLAANSSSTKLGLKNAAQRLTLLMGPKATLSIQQTGPNVETSVVIPQ